MKIMFLKSNNKSYHFFKRCYPWFCCKVFQKIYFSVKMEKKDREDRVMNHFKGKQFKKDVIIVAVGYYLRYNLSYREVQELLYDRGINVCHTTIYFKDFLLSFLTHF